MSKTFKEFIKLFGPLALGICLVATWFLYTRNQSHRELIGQRQKTIVALDSQIIARYVALRASDAKYLARLVARRLNAQSGIQNIRGIEDDFDDFARSRQFYYILRFLDETGMERIRLDRSFAGPVISPLKSMQNKSDRYYFQEALKAGKDDVYISRFDLNMEHGRVQKPFKPTLRFACPVIDNTGRKRGIVVLNFNGSALLDNLEFQGSSGEGVPMLTTGHGYWILAANPADEWGHVLEEAKDASMPNRFPQAWAQISNNKKGQIVTPHGLFSFDTIGIIPGSVISGIPPSPDAAKLRWKIFTWVPSVQLAVPWMSLFIFLIVLFLTLLFLGCWHLARYRIRQAEVESQLRESEERTMAISQSAQDAIAMVDDQDRITYWNPAAERLFGYEAKEVRELKLHDLLAPEELRSDARKALTDFALNGEGRSVGKVLEFSALRKDGTQVPVELAVSSFKLKGRWYAVGSMRDIARRKKNELKLERSEETSRALINAPTESAMLVEPSGTIVAINEVGAHKLGGSAEEMIGQNAYDLIFPDLTDNRKNIFKQVLETAEPANFENIRAGRRFLINVYPTKTPDGSVDRLAIFARDVTEQHEAEQALMLSEQRFRDVSEAVGEYIWETDEEGDFKILTDDVVSVLGYTSEELTGRPPFDLVPKEDIKDYKKWHDDTYDKREPFTNIEIRNITKDGRIIWMQISGVPYYDEGGEFLGYRGAGMNITDRKAAENAIKASERKLRALAESAYDAIIMIDTNGRVSFWNHAAEQLFGYQESEVLGNEVHALIAPPEERAKAELGMYEFAMTGDGAAVGRVEETFGLHKDGTKIPIERSVAGFRLGEDWYAVATIRDITERKETEAKLRKLATTDGLTGLYNRRRFMELSEREFTRSLRYGRPLAMFMIDIDHFKKVNDTHGHDVGDKVLRSMSETAILALRNADILGRIGGEEFGVLLPETGEDAALEVAERLRSSVEQTVITADSKNLSITVSIGVACLDQETRTIEQLLKRADVALYDAKQSGRNRSILN